MLFIDEVRLWDGTGSPPQAGVDVLIDGDRIIAVADDLAPPEGSTVIDGRGLTATPGLIDAHVHLALDPGATLRGDDAATHTVLLRQHLAAYLACGVTTVLDPAIPFPDWDALPKDTAGPEVIGLGPPLSPRGGYVAEVLPQYPTVGSRDEVRAHLAEVKRRGGIGAKVPVEPGIVYSLWPTHTPESAAWIREEAAAAGLPLYVHARSPKSWTFALDHLNPHAIVHGLDQGDRALATRAAAAGVYVMPTLSIVDSNRAAWEPARLTDPLVQLTVPEIELRTAQDPATPMRFARAMLKITAPGLPFKGMLARVMMSERGIRGRHQHGLDGTRALHEAGVKLVLGSDSGSWPLFPYEFHGPTSLAELGLLVEAGLTPAEALLTATQNAAEMLGRDDIGRIAPGARADLVLYPGDPLADIGAVRQASWVVVRGEARKPAEWVGKR